MEITLTNCNNIDSGKVEIIEGRLNIKYAVNGTGKSTIAKALSYKITDNKDDLNDLIPFKFFPSEDREHLPEVSGVDGIRSVAIFNEDYIDQYIFKPDELVENSFEIFVKTQDYDNHMQEIENLVRGIKDIFQSQPKVEELLQDMNYFIDSFGNAKSGISGSGPLLKGLGKGNKIENVPQGLEDYREFLQHTDNVKWLKWQMSGSDYLDIANKCPYCTSNIDKNKEKIVRVSAEFDAKTVEHLNKILEVFQRLENYFSVETNAKIKVIAKKIPGLTEEQKTYLLEIKKQITTLREKLEGIKHLGFYSLKDVDKVVEQLKVYKIELDYLSHINTEYTQSKIVSINQSLDDILAKVGKLEGEINQQNITINRTIDQYHREINTFLTYAGYNYKISIEFDEHGSYKMKLKHKDSDIIINRKKTPLSYGERNAFALVLFMYHSLKDNPDIIILDDPISSFDGNKKFAILNMLFMGKTCLKNRTVLMLSHEFNSVIDAIYNFSHNINPSPKATFLENNKGVLTEKQITKNDIQSFSMIAKNNIYNLQENINKLIYLRRLLEIENPDGESCQLLSNLFHKREKPIFRSNDGTEREMTELEIQTATKEIKKYNVSDFDYSNEYLKVSNEEKMKTIYCECKNNYEKLQLYRILKNDNHPNDVIRKFVNKTYHIENDYLFQLNPCEYEIVPQYIIDECDRDILKQN